MIHDTKSAQISQKQDEHNIYVIMKTTCPPGYHHNGFVATDALRHIITYILFIYIYIYTCHHRGHSIITLIRSRLEKLPDFWLVLSKQLPCLKYVLKKLYFAAIFQPATDVTNNYVLDVVRVLNTPFVKLCVYTCNMFHKQKQSLEAFLLKRFSSK